MIFDRLLIDIIIQYLAKNTTTTVSALFVVTSSSRDPVSLPQLYNIIGKLCDRHVLVKKKSIISLNRGRVVHYLSLAKDLSLVDHTLDTIYDLPVGKIQSFSGKSLYEMGSLYGNLYVKLIEQTGQKTLYHYQSHLYHSEKITDRGHQFWSALEAMGVNHYFCCGSNTFLDRYEMEFISHYQSMKTVHKQLPIFPSEGYMMVVIGSWIIDCFLPYGLAQDFEKIYNSVVDEGLFDTEEFFALFQRKEKIQVNVDHNPSRALSLQTVIQTRCFPKYISSTFSDL